MFVFRMTLTERWLRLPLLRKFILLGTVYTVAAMVLCGVLMTTFLSDILVQRRGGIIAAVGQRVLSPPIESVVEGDIPDEALARLEATLSGPVFSAQFPFLEVWLPDGTLVYSNDPHDSDEDAPGGAILEAFNGKTSVKFTGLKSDAVNMEGFGQDYIDIVFPLRKAGTDQIIAAAQLHEVTSSLKQDLYTVTIASWITIAVISLIVMLGLFGIVLEGSRTIERQKFVLARRLELSRSRAVRYRDAMTVAEQATQNFTLLTDKYLRTIGTDLHDGPAQTISLAVLKLDNVRRQSLPAKRSAAVGEVEMVLANAMAEIRAIAMELVLPDIASLDIAQVINNAVTQHVGRTGASLSVDNRCEPIQVAADISVCVFRFVQEGLNNAFKHGLPEGQELTALSHQGVLKLSITNRYKEGEVARPSDHFGIGLFGLRARVQSAGGSFAFMRGDGLSQLEMWLPFSPIVKSP